MGKFKIKPASPPRISAEYAWERFVLSDFIFSFEDIR